MSDITFVIESMGGGGAQQVLAQVLESVLEDGKKATLITFLSSTEDVVAVPSGIERKILGGAAGHGGIFLGAMSNLARIARLRKLLRASASPTVVGFVGTTNVLVALASVGLGCRVVICERNDPSRQSLGRIWNLLRRLSYPLADLVTANSMNAVAALSTFVAPEKLIYLPNPIRHSQKQGVASKIAPTIIAVGRLHEQKGYDVILAGFAAFARQVPDWRLRILGDGPLKNKLIETSIELGIADRVEFAGYCRDPFPHLYGADLFVMASRYEGTPNALLEAMGCGLAVVVSNGIPGATAIVKDGYNGLLFDAENREALARAFVRLCADVELRSQLGEAAKTNAALKRQSALSKWKQCLFPDLAHQSSDR